MARPLFRWRRPRCCGAGAMLCEGGLGLGDQRPKAVRISDGEIGEDLAVDDDARLLDAVHQLRVGHALLARAGIDALDPQPAELALLRAAVAIGVAQRLLDALQCRAESRRRAADVTLGFAKNLL